MDRAEYREYIASLGRTVCPCCGYATSYDRYLTCLLCDWAEPLAENPEWGVAASQRKQLLSEARERYLTTGSALHPTDHETWAGEWSREELRLRKELQKRLEYLKAGERLDASEAWAEVDALVARLDDEAERRRQQMPRPTPGDEVVRHGEPVVRSPRPEAPSRTVVSRTRELPGVARFAIYLTLVVALVLVDRVIEQQYGFKRMPVILGELGVIYLIASSGRPWWLYATVRRLGWFRGVESDRAMRGILAVFGAVLVVIGVVGR